VTPSLLLPPSLNALKPTSSHGAGHVHPHIFRKTALQSAWIGDDEIDKRVAHDAGVGKKVLMAHYVTVLREKSNRTFRRILEGLPAEVLRRFGHADDDTCLEDKLQAAHEARDWAAVKMLADALENKKRQVAVRG
jgi:hypothetical protein